MKEMDGTSLENLSLPVKALFTGYLLAIGLGLLMAGAQIMLTHGMADGKPGLSLDDIVYSYYGNREGSTLEAKLNGSMKENAPAEARLAMIKWARAGAPEGEWESKIKPLTDQYCVACHANMPGLAKVGEKDAMIKVAAVDSGVSISTLTRVSHIHLFGIAFIFFFVGWIFSFATGFSTIAKSLLIFTPFMFLIIDVASWWLTKMNSNFAWL
ncbi:MAG TPA: elongation factor-1 alpha, partial [Gallionella sp.]|nr:elongation factor-1 alpha [Gallionella sp.]